MTDRDLLADERRRFVRINYNSTALIKEALIDNIPISFKNPLKLTTLNISLGGIGAMVDNELPVNSEFEMSLTTESDPLSIMGKIVYCDKKEDCYRVGIDFVSPNKDLRQAIKKIVLKSTARNQGLI